MPGGVVVDSSSGVWDEWTDAKHRGIENKRKIPAEPALQGTGISGFMREQNSKWSPAELCLSRVDYITIRD